MDGNTNYCCLIQNKNIYFFSYYNGSNGKDQGYIQFEQDVLAPLAGTGKVYALEVF